MCCFIYSRFEGDFLLRISAECNVRLAFSRVFHGEACLQFSDVRCVCRYFWCQVCNGVFIRCNIAFVGLNFCFYITQLFEVDRVAVCRSGCYVGDFIVIRIDALTIDICLVANFKCVTCNAGETRQVFIQFDFVAYFFIVVYVISNRQIIFGGEFRAFDGVGRSLSVFRFFRNGHIVARFDDGLAVFELGDVHRIGVRRTCGEVGDLSCLIRRADRDSAVSGFPCRIVCCRCFIRGGIVPENTRSGTCYGTGTQSHAAVLADVGVIAENGDVRFFGFRFRFLRADNDVSVDVFQLVVVAQYQVMTGIGQFIFVACNDIVGQSGLAFCIRKVVAHAGNTGIDCTCYRVTVTVDSDMASFFFKEADRAFRRILIFT